MTPKRLLLAPETTCLSTRNLGEPVLHRPLSAVSHHRPAVRKNDSPRSMILTELGRAARQLGKLKSKLRIELRGSSDGFLTTTEAVGTIR